MEILIDKLEFGKKLLGNSSTAWDINRKRYRKGCLLTDINVKMWLNTEKHLLKR